MNKKFWLKMNVTPGPWGLPHFVTGDAGECKCGFLWASPDGEGNVCEIPAQIYRADPANSMMDNDSKPDHERACNNARVIAGCLEAYEIVIGVCIVYDNIMPMKISEHPLHVEITLLEEVFSPMKWPEIRKAWEETVDD